MKFIIITKKKWDLNNFKKINRNIFVHDKINLRKLKKINPNIIFFIHWSKIINKSLFEKYLCIQFHSSDLPRGKGGSPIQNQILLNKKKTKLTAFKITNKLDAGPICMKSDLSLHGSALDIFKRLENTSIKMIKKIIKKKRLIFKNQIGKPSFFKRRKPEESNIKLKKIKNINKLYDFLRMLDAPSYPNAYMVINRFKFTFHDIKIIRNEINAKVKIIKNEK